MREFAIDLEVSIVITGVWQCVDPLPTVQHHSYRTFLGITCLMQISTRFHDYLIDTLQVREHMHILLDPFTDPTIVKVTDTIVMGTGACFHGFFSSGDARGGV